MSNRTEAALVGMRNLPSIESPCESGCLEPASRSRTRDLELGSQERDGPAVTPPRSAGIPRVKTCRRFAAAPRAVRRRLGRMARSSPSPGCEIGSACTRRYGPAGALRMTPPTARRASATGKEFDRPLVEQERPPTHRRPMAAHHLPWLIRLFAPRVPDGLEALDQDTRDGLDIARR